MYVVEYLARNVFGRITANKEILPENEATKLAKMVAKKSKKRKRKMLISSSLVLLKERSAKMETNKFVLDPCCGGKMFYFDKKDERVLFCDIRKIQTQLCDGREFEVNPDRVENFASMPFADNKFKLVVFDPPHLIRNSGTNKSKFQEIYGTLHPTGYQQIKYGCLYGDWREMLAKGFSECFRVLEPGGTMIFKWNETDIPVKEILKLTPEKPLFGNRSGKASKTHWIVFIKGGEIYGVQS